MNMMLHILHDQHDMGAQLNLVVDDEPANHKERNIMSTTYRTYTIEQIRLANVSAGRHWFDAKAMRWFGSRVHRTTYGPDSTGRVYFVSSEFTGFERSERAYTVRVFDPANGSVSASSDFNEFPTRALAHAAARKIARS